MNRVEPNLEEMREWASGLRDCHDVIACQWVNWAYWYLGYDEPEFKPYDSVTNESICKLTEACRFRLKELADGV